MSANESATRAKHHLPSVLLTLLSIVQALALELVWEFVSEREALYVWSFETALTWVQVVSTFLGVLLIWLMYSGLVMRLRWLPSMSDFIMPFAIGVIEFGLAGALGAETLGRWFLMLAIAYGVVTWVTQTTMRRARLDGENEEFFATQPPATGKDFLAPVVLVATFAIFGLLLEGAESVPRWAVAPMGVAAGMLVFQLYLIDVYWRRSMEAPRLV